MLTTTIVRKDLKEIRYYFSRQKFFEDNSNFVGDNAILEKIAKYNAAVCSASPRLYEIYIYLYLKDYTQEALSGELGYAFETISRLNSQLIKHFQQTVDVVA